MIAKLGRELEPAFRHVERALRLRCRPREIEIELAAALPEVWDERFDEPADAPRQLDALRKQAEKLSAAVGLSLQAALDRLGREGRSDVWVEISEADATADADLPPARGGVEVVRAKRG